MSIQEKFRKPLKEALSKYIFNRKSDNVQVDTEEMLIFCLEIFAEKTPIGQTRPLIYSIESIVEHLNNSYSFTYKDRRINDDLL